MYYCGDDYYYYYGSENQLICLYSEYDMDITMPDVLILMISVISLIGNCMIIRVMSLPHNRNSSTAVLFMGLAFSDFAQAFFFVFVTLSLTNLQGNFDVFDRTIIDIFGYTFKQISSFVLAYIGIERALGVKLPHRVKIL